MIYALGLAFLLAGFWLIVLGSRLHRQPKVGEQVSVWRGLVPVLDEPPQRFYQRLYQSLQTSLQDRLSNGDSDQQSTPGSGHASSSSYAPVEVVLTGMGFGPHRLFAAPSLFAERPMYLLVRYQHLRCYVYAAQTPTGLFISSWGYSAYHVGEGADRRMAFSKRAWKYFSRQTLFQVDATIIFTYCVQEIISEVVDGYREEKGLQPMEAMERRPILHAFYQNPFYRDHYASDYSAPHAASQLPFPQPASSSYAAPHSSPPSALFDLVSPSDNGAGDDRGQEERPVSETGTSSEDETPAGIAIATNPVAAGIESPEPAKAKPHPPEPSLPGAMFPVDDWLREDRLDQERLHGDYADSERQTKEGEDS